MSKDCNGCFGASFGDCQRCQPGSEQEKARKLDITPQLAIAAYNTLIDYCKQIDDVNCSRCIFGQIYYTRSDESICACNFYHICPTDWDRVTLPSLDGNTVTYIKDGQIKRVTCGRREEAEELFEEVCHVQKQRRIP